MNSAINNIGIISTLPPTQCGIATYAFKLIQNLKLQYPALKIQKFELVHSIEKTGPAKFVLRNDLIEDYFKASELINSSDIDVVDIQHEFKIFGKPDGENIEVLLDNIKKPIASTLHTVHPNLSEKRERVFEKIVMRSNLLFLFSEDAKILILKKYNVPSSKVIVIPHGVPTIPFRLPNECLKRKYYSGELIFVSAGHMRESKGYEMALNALSELKKITTIKFRYFIAGADHPENVTATPYRNQLIELINKLGLRENVTLINKYLSEKRLIELLQMADVCLVPYSRKEQSSSGILALMLACGRPIVTTPFQYAISQITTMSGVVADSFLPVDFTKAIGKLFESKNSWETMMQYNHAITQSWNWPSIADRYVLNYNNILPVYKSNA